MSRIKHYPPWFAAIHQKNEEAKKKGLSYGQLEALDWEKKGRPRRKVGVEPDEWMDDYPSEPEESHAISEKAMYNREIRMKNKAKYEASQAVIREVREKLGLSRTNLSRLIGMSIDSIKSWERGEYPAQWGKLVVAMPELAEYVPKEENNDSNQKEPR